MHFSGNLKPTEPDKRHPFLLIPPLFKEVLAYAFVLHDDVV